MVGTVRDIVRVKGSGFDSDVRVDFEGAVASTSFTLSIEGRDPHSHVDLLADARAERRRRGSEV